MKRLIIILLCLVLVFSFTACNKDNNDSSSDGNNDGNTKYTFDVDGTTPQEMLSGFPTDFEFLNLGEITSAEYSYDSGSTAYGLDFYPEDEDIDVFEAYMDEYGSDFIYDEDFESGEMYLDDYEVYMGYYDWGDGDIEYYIYLYFDGSEMHDYFGDVKKYVPSDYITDYSSYSIRVGNEYPSYYMDFEYDSTMDELETFFTDLLPDAEVEYLDGDVYILLWEDDVYIDVSIYADGTLYISII